MPTDWEVLVNSQHEILGIVCEECLTPAELEQTAEDVILTAYEVEFEETD
jgi:hypothetical protein